MSEHNFPIDSASISDKGLSDKRPQNEDSYLELKDKRIFAVADGVGGAQAGDVASQMAVEIIGEAFLNLEGDYDEEEVMRIAIEKANSAIYRVSKELPQLSTMATTCVALQITGNIGTIGHVGDSRLYRLDGNGILYRETDDHSVVEEEVRAGRMTVEQAANHPSKNIISRALGAEPEVEIDLKTIMFDPDTTFLLCSDGITRHITDLEIRDLLVTSNTPEEICQRMKEICYKRGAEDNLTAVIVRVRANSEVKIISHSQKSFSEQEEATVATARAPLVNTAVVAGGVEKNGEIQTKPLQMPANMESHSKNFENLEERSVPASKINEQEGTSIKVKDFTSENLEKKQANFIIPDDDKTEVSKKSGTNFVLTAISTLFAFIIGAVLGAGIYYAVSKTTAPPPPEIQQPVVQNEKPEQNIFEEDRRRVDLDPETYLEEYAANPETAEDYFHIGRAQFLTRRFDAARTSFIESKKRLEAEEVSDDNAQVVENDIEIMLAVINNENAKTNLDSYLKKKSEEIQNDEAPPKESNQ